MRRGPRVHDGPDQALEHREGAAEHAGRVWHQGWARLQCEPLPSGPAARTISAIATPGQPISSWISVCSIGVNSAYLHVVQEQGWAVAEVEHQVALLVAALQLEEQRQSPFIVQASAEVGPRRRGDSDTLHGRRPKEQVEAAVEEHADCELVDGRNFKWGGERDADAAEAAGRPSDGGRPLRKSRRRTSMGIVTLRLRAAALAKVAALITMYREEPRDPILRSGPRKPNRSRATTVVACEMEHARYARRVPEAHHAR